LKDPTPIRDNMVRLFCSREQCRILFAASLVNVDVVCRHIERFLGQWDLQALKFEMILGAREILNNAVVHGSGQDEQKSVSFEIQLEPSQLMMRVEDQGPGFDFTAVSKACELGCENGRGICILDHYFDRVRFIPPGNKVELVKNLEPRVYLKEINMTEIIIEGNLASVKLEKEIISTNIDSLKKEFKQILQGTVTRLRLDLAGVTYIDSMGLGLLVATHNSLQKLGSRLELQNVSADILKLLKQMRLDKHFTID